MHVRFSAYRDKFMQDQGLSVLMRLIPGLHILVDTCSMPVDM
jgi:hypothetical protein